MRLMPEHKWAALLALGHEGLVQPLTQEEEEIATHIRRVVKPQKKECFANCQRAVLRLGTDQFHYCEGFFFPEGLIAVEHAWLELKSGAVLDITVPHSGLSVTSGQARSGDYFGLTIDPEIISEYLEESLKHGSLLDDYELNWKYARRILFETPVLA